MLFFVNNFHSSDFKDFYNFEGIDPIPLGPYPPWPNRAETAVRLFKRQFAKVVSSCK